MTRSIRVLHLEDSPRDAEMIRHRLEVADVSWDIVLANSKDSFEAALTLEPFDLIISDYNLPGYDGVTALKQAQTTQPDVPVILISGTVVEEEAVRCLQIGATDYLLKGRLDRLVPAVERALHEAETRRARKRVEGALGESEARKAAILDSVLDCIVTMDANGIVIEFNSAAARTFGYTKEEAIGRSLADLIIPPRFRERHSAGLAHYLATGEGPLIGKLIEIRAMRSDGAELPVELAITAIRSGSATLFTGVLRDITARQQAEATRARLAAIVDSSDDAIISVAMDDTILTWNAGAERLFGYAASETIGRSRALLVPAGQSVELVSIMERAARGEAGEPLETRRMRKDGSVVDISLVFSPMTDATGRITGVSTIARDITERNQTVEALRTSEERMRFALQGAAVGIWDMDCATQAVRWSEILETQYCLKPGTFGGTLEAFVERIHPEDRESVVETVGKAMKSGGDFSVLHRTICPDGTVRWLSGAGRVLLGEHGEPVRAVGISLNVTERHTLEAQYHQAQKMEAVGRLAGGVAHDFNNLLTVILGFCELLLADLKPNDPRQADIAEIQKAGARAAGLTRQLLAFSRKEIIQPTLLDLNTIVADIRTMLARLIGEDVTIVLDLGAALSPVKADRGQIEQIVLNLAVNARDAMPGGGTLTIKTAYVELNEHDAHPELKLGPYIVLTVTDTGTGMTPEVQARLFEPFFTTKEAGKGTGLGMATVHGIATRCGGSVTVDSAVGRGTSFMVYFPRADSAEPVLAVPPPVERRHAGLQTVLVVEDAEGLRELTKRLLERQGYTVLLAASADEARQLFDEHPSIDLLLTDVVMPGASGPELVKQLVERRPTLKVIYMSGYTDEAIAHHGVLDPGIVFLHKPFSSESLGQKIRQVIDR
jgi:two-component system cell cycle sensor histidine kinase/response regulator CckA